MPEDLKEEVEGKIATLKAAIASNNLAEMQPAMTDLTNSVQQLGQAIYSQTGDPEQPTEGGPTDQEPAGDGPAEDDQSGGDTVEGEFREV